MVRHRTPDKATAAARSAYRSPSLSPPICLVRSSFDNSELELLDREFDKLKEAINKRRGLYARVLQVRSP